MQRRNGVENSAIGYQENAECYLRRGQKLLCQPHLGVWTPGKESRRPGSRAEGERLAGILEVWADIARKFRAGKELGETLCTDGNQLAVREGGNVK